MLSSLGVDLQIPELHWGLRAPGPVSRKAHGGIPFRREASSDMPTTPDPADHPGPTGGRRVILVSNRGPVQYGREGGARTTTRGAGGLVTALSGLGRQLQDGVWVCSAMSDEDVVVARESPGGQ